MARGRDNAIRFARRDWRAALTLASGIAETLFRRQALGWVARYAPEDQFESIALGALAEHSGPDDPYLVVSGSAWPLRTLVERGSGELARSFVPSLLRLASTIAQPGAYAEALFLLLQGIWPDRGWRPVFDALLRPPFPRLHWRQMRAMWSAIAMVSRVDPQRARDALTQISDVRLRARIEREIARADRSPHSAQPRTFYWTDSARD